MNTTITGKDFTLTDGVKDAVEGKVKKIEKFAGEEASVEIKLSARGKNAEHYRAEITVRFDKNVVRAEVTGEDMYRVIGDAVDVVVERIKKVKGKLKKAGGKTIRTQEPENIEEIDKEYLKRLGINRRKAVKAEVMTTEDAIEEMEYTGHDFYTFRDYEDHEALKIVYRRNDVGYGVIDIE